MVVVVVVEVVVVDVVVDVVVVDVVVDVVVVVVKPHNSFISVYNSMILSRISTCLGLHFLAAGLYTPI